MATPSDYRYTKEHEWVRPLGEEAEVGITDYAQHSLGDIVYVEFPKVGATITAGESFGTVESVKAVSEIFAPVSGTVLAINETLTTSPELLNTEPYTGAWLLRVKLSEPGQIQSLMNAEEYDAFIAEGEE